MCRPRSQVVYSIGMSVIEFCKFFADDIGVVMLPLERDICYFLLIGSAKHFIWLFIKFRRMAWEAKEEALSNQI